MLELRFPDNEAGWAQWARLMEKVRENCGAYSMRCEEIEPGKLRGVIHLM